MKKHSRTVQAYLTSLEDKGFIRRVERLKPNNGQEANGYDLSGPRDNRVYHDAPARGRIGN
jgi:hypothetical protein